MKTPESHVIVLELTNKGTKRTTHPNTLKPLHQLTTEQNQDVNKCLIQFKWRSDVYG
jgi:hypothetical protein